MIDLFCIFYSVYFETTVLSTTYGRVKNKNKSYIFTPAASRHCCSVTSHSSWRFSRLPNKDGWAIARMSSSLADTLDLRKFSTISDDCPNIALSWMAYRVDVKINRKKICSREWSYIHTCGSCMLAGSLFLDDDENVCGAKPSSSIEAIAFSLSICSTIPRLSIETAAAAFLSVETAAFSCAFIFSLTAFAAALLYPLRL